MAPDRGDGRTVIDFATHPKLYGGSERRDRIARDVGAPINESAGAFVDRLREYGADGAVLSQPSSAGGDDVAATAAANDALREAVDGESVFGLAGVPTAAGETDAAAELERCLEDGLHGGVVETRSAGIELHDPAMDAVLEVANDAGAALFVHPKLRNSVHPDVLSDEWLLNASLGREVALCASIVKVIHSGVFDRYPDLTLVYHHLGGNVACALGRHKNQLDRHFASPDEPLPGSADDPEGGSLKPFGEFRAQLEDHVYLDTCGHDAFGTVLRTALAEFPASQLVFGTDFPFATQSAADFREMVDVVDRETSETDAARILGGNALDVLVNVD